MGSFRIAPSLFPVFFFEGLPRTSSSMSILPMTYMLSSQMCRFLLLPFKLKLKLLVTWFSPCLRMEPLQPARFFLFSVPAALTSYSKGPWPPPTCFSRPNVICTVIGPEAPDFRFCAQCIPPLDASGDIGVSESLAPFLIGAE